MAENFDNILNFRDVGATVNQVLGQSILKEGLLYRSARPGELDGPPPPLGSIPPADHHVPSDDASVDDRRRLKNEFGIKTVIDLRTKTEHLKQAEKRKADLKTPTLLQSNAALAEPVLIPGLRYVEIKVTGKRFEKHLLKQLSWSSYLKLISLHVTGYRIEAIRIICQEVMLPRGLVGMGEDTLDQSGIEIAEVLRAFIKPASLPILVHCTQGKDRTGIITALVLMVLHVPTDAIAHDYHLTQGELVLEKEARLAEIEEIGLTPDWGDCPKDFVQKVHAHIQTQYGGVESYLDSIGFSSPERRRLVETLGA